MLVRETVGPDGGLITFDGGSVRIPPQALASPVALSVWRTAVGERLRFHAPDGKLLSYEPGEVVAYRFEPTDAVSGNPVTITLPDPVRGGQVFAVEDGTVIFLPARGSERQVSIDVFDLRFRSGRAP